VLAARLFPGHDVIGQQGPVADPAIGGAKDTGDIFFSQAPGRALLINLINKTAYHQKQSGRATQRGAPGVLRQSTNGSRRSLLPPLLNEEDRQGDGHQADQEPARPVIKRGGMGQLVLN